MRKRARRRSSDKRRERWERQSKTMKVATMERRKGVVMTGVVMTGVVMTAITMRARGRSQHSRRCGLLLRMRS
jgi:hypothetical protein